MSDSAQPSRAAVRAKLAEFLAGTERLFVCPTAHPTAPTAFCPCDGPRHIRFRFYLRALLLGLVLRTDFGRLKISVLRWLGAKVGRNVYLAPGVWIDPLLPQLLTLEDEVFIGSGARLGMHEFRVGAFVAGRVTIRRRALIGGWALLGPGIEIGPGASVAAGAVVGRDVPAGAVALGNPARILQAADSIRPCASPGTTTHDAEAGLGA